MNVKFVVDQVSQILTQTVKEPKRMKTKVIKSRKELSKKVVLTLTLG
jgi:hypothetical protein